MTTPRPIPRRAPFAALALVVACSGGCKRPPDVNKEPPAAAVPVVESAAPPAPSATAAPADTIPTLVAEKFAPEGATVSGPYAIEGGVAVTRGSRVGLVTGDTVTWVGSIPSEMPALGPNTITSVLGRAPDLVAAIYVSGNGRAPQPTYQLLTGKKESITAAMGGGWGSVHGAARVGETIFVATEDNYPGPRITPVHGPRLVRHLLTPAEAGCQPGEVSRPEDMPAVVPTALESTPAGTLISLGTLCDKRGPAAEVWDKDGKTRIVDLGRWWKKRDYRARLLKGEGDALWAVNGGWTAIVLRYEDGAFSALPELERPAPRALRPLDGWALLPA
jgi:hypothetical protein